MDDESIGSWLAALASSDPAPGGGAAAALEVAIGAALVAMVCNLTIGKPAFAEHEAAMTDVRARADELRRQATLLAAEDADAFTAVIAAYRLPKETDEERAERARRIQSALAVAADVPRRTAAAASEVLDLAERVVPDANPNVISDAGAAAGAARGALQTALLNIDANLASLTDTALVHELEQAEETIRRDLGRADALVDAVRARMSA
jgi:formiminotetrahydrofolate cyclodeaminase